VLDRTVADGTIPGAVASVNIPGFQTWHGASGLASPERGSAMTPDTRVRIASISKSFTAAVALQLVEEGVLSLDDPLSTWFPDLVPAASAITVRSLLQHTSGLYDYLEDRRYVALPYQDPGRAFAPNELVAYAAQFAPSFQPNAPDAWDYSSTNFVILGMVIEQATGNSLASEMRTRIFEPLGLESTFFVPDEAVEEPFATGHSRGSMQREVAMSFAYATANVVSTAGDVNRFGRALFAGELLGDEARALMLEFVSGKGQYNMPTLGYGLGVMRNQLPVGRSAEVATVYGHIGGFGGFRSALWHAPNSGITVSLGVNQGATDPNLLATALLDAALTGVGQ
jgi:D-alanyl-D-alanine carboxypeptidase